MLAQQCTILEELLSHHYVLPSYKEVKQFKKSVKCRDGHGDNIYHDIFLLDTETRNDYLDMVSDDKNKIKVFISDKTKFAFTTNKIASKPGEKGTKEDLRGIQPDFEFRVGKFASRNNMAILPHEVYHSHRLELCEDFESKIRHEIMEIYEADYVIVTLEESPGD